MCGDEVQATGWFGLRFGVFRVCGGLLPAALAVGLDLTSSLGFGSGTFRGGEDGYFAGRVNGGPSGVMGCKVIAG